MVQKEIQAYTIYTVKHEKKGQAPASSAFSLGGFGKRPICRGVNLYCICHAPKIYINTNTRTKGVAPHSGNHIIPAQNH